MNTKKHFFTTFDLILSAFFVTLITVGAYIKIPIFIVPFTLQIFFVLLAGHFLKPRAALLTLVAYICLGLIGLPVFTGGGGLGYVLTPNFGYILGFLFMGVFISFFAHRNEDISSLELFVINLISLAIIYSFAFIYIVLLNLVYFKEYVDLSNLLVTGILVFLPSNIFFCYISVPIYRRLNPILKRFNR